MTDHDSPQRIVLAALLHAHPRLIGEDDLASQLADVPRVRKALRVLVDDGSRRASATVWAVRAPQCASTPSRQFGSR
jgi:hypothetical protein